MLSFLNELEHWAQWQQSTGDNVVSITYRRGRTDVPKQSANIGLESAVALGVVAAWDSGEIEAEVLEIDWASRLYVYSGVVYDAAELCQILDRTLGAVRGLDPG